jgi:hypothetical protein
VFIDVTLAGKEIASSELQRLAQNIRVDLLRLVRTDEIGLHSYLNFTNQIGPVITQLPEQLMAQAEFLVRNAGSNEANVRRAVSSAYYALFHLLVRDESVEPDHEQTLRLRLSTVAQAFVNLQQARHKADYDIEEQFQPRDAALDVAQARLAFPAWSEVKDEPLAQRYLYSLLFWDRF